MSLVRESLHAPDKYDHDLIALIDDQLEAEAECPEPPRRL